eukprot:6410435-Pyramimonas_sp.AAC.1
MCSIHRPRQARFGESLSTLELLSAVDAEFLIFADKTVPFIARSGDFSIVGRGRGAGRRTFVALRAGAGLATGNVGWLCGIPFGRLVWRVHVCMLSYRWRRARVGPRRSRLRALAAHNIRRQRTAALSTMLGMVSLIARPRARLYAIVRVVEHVKLYHAHGQ